MTEPSILLFCPNLKGLAGVVVDVIVTPFPCIVMLAPFVLQSISTVIVMVPNPFSNTMTSPSFALYSAASRDPTLPVPPSVFVTVRTSDFASPTVRRQRKSI
ncbi:hypothetical protein Barb4_04427 [Bacteroidales bacterium Barb4]|nr:hypothetical protein Barb4_04427 [Bacteroidales bacterium Barb4]